MDEGGCVWVHWGTGGVNNTKTSQAGGMEGVSDQDLGAMAGEISPDIMFWEVRRKSPRMGADGCKSVRMGAIECVITWGSKNKAKRAING